MNRHVPEVRKRTTHPPTSDPPECGKTCTHPTCRAHSAKLPAYSAMKPSGGATPIPASSLEPRRQARGYSRV
eukprot:1293665-Prymnesium_polylepis.1